MTGVKAMKHKLARSGTREKLWQPILLVMPFFLLFFLFTILPIISSVVLSFTSYDMLNTPKFVGIENYVRMLLYDDIFKIAVENTLVFAVITGPLGYALCFLLAWFINELPPIPRSVVSFIFYSPVLVGNVYFIWAFIFSGDTYGLANGFLLEYGFIKEPIIWLKDSRFALGIVMIVQLWMSLGTSFLANISGLQNIGTELYEVGAIEGIRNRWQEAWYITLPSMKSILLFSAVMQIQASFSVSAVATALAGNPSTNYITHTIVTHMEDYGAARYEMGYAATISVFLFALMAGTRLVIGKLLNALGKD